MPQKSIEKRRVYNRAYYAKHKDEPQSKTKLEKRRASSRAYYAKHKEQVKQD